jgi:hypothetical protein
MLKANPLPKDVPVVRAEPTLVATCDKPFQPKIGCPLFAVYTPEPESPNLIPTKFVVDAAPKGAPTPEHTPIVKPYPDGRLVVLIGLTESNTPMRILDHTLPIKRGRTHSSALTCSAMSFPDTKVLVTNTAINFYTNPPPREVLSV